jgi:hypothetical protein
MGKYNEELAQAGIPLPMDGLRPSSQGARVRVSGRSRTVSDGPFAGTKELIAELWMWKVTFLAEAIEWVKRCPNPMPEDSDIEIRPAFEVARWETRHPRGADGHRLEVDEQLRQAGQLRVSPGPLPGVVIGGRLGRHPDERRGSTSPNQGSRQPRMVTADLVAASLLDQDGRVIAACNRGSADPPRGTHPELTIGANP